MLAIQAASPQTSFFPSNVGRQPVTEAGRFSFSNRQEGVFLRCRKSSEVRDIRRDRFLHFQAKPFKLKFLGVAPRGAVTAPEAAPGTDSQSKRTSPSPIAIPRSIHDISNGDHILGFGADLAEDHPGYHDEEYKRRRMGIVALARQHRIGEPIPTVDYTPEETQVWGTVLTELMKLYPTHACSQFLENFPKFGFRADKIPQLQEVSEVLQRSTGWQIRPVAGLLHPRDFLNGLAFRTFHSTQYIRHASNPMYTPEPDICHELLGHVPMLADKDFADLAQAIGLASLGATEKQIWHLTKLYWYTVEFGTVMEAGEVRAFGAGLLSSFGELRYMRSGDKGRYPKFAELDPFATLPKMSYKDGFQGQYFLCSSFADAAEKLRAYARSIQRPEVADLVMDIQKSDQLG